jgi:hypothetical protein
VSLDLIEFSSAFCFQSSQVKAQGKSAVGFEWELELESINTAPHSSWFYMRARRFEEETGR